MKITKEFFTETTIISSIPVIGYLIAFLFQSGYNSVFGLSYDFINISLESMFKALAALSIIFLFMFIITEFYDVYVDLRHDLRLPVLRLFYALLFSFFLYVIFSDTDYTKKYLFPFLGIVGLFLLKDFFLPLVFNYKTKGYWNKIAAAEAKRQERLAKQNGNILGSISSLLPGGAVTYFFIIFFVIIGSYQLGVGAALNSKNYFTTANGSELVVKTDRNTFLTATIRDGIVQREFKVYSLSSSQPSFEFKKIDHKLAFSNLEKSKKKTR